MQTMLVRKITPYPVGPDEFEFDCPPEQVGGFLLKKIKPLLRLKSRVRVFKEDLAWYLSHVETCEILYIAYPKSLSGD
jgi:hypothetical protein